MSKNRKSLEVMRNLLGEELFQVITETFAGEKIKFPKNVESLDREGRNKKIQDDFEKGEKVTALMKQYELSESQIYKIIGTMS